MDNQHKLIKGYRDLTADEIRVMNEAKALAAQVGEFIEKLRSGNDKDFSVDVRWLSIAQTDLQKGFMSLVRSVAQPTTF